MLRADWVERIFDRLSVRYGVAFTRQWEGLDPNAVKADWAEVLSGFTADDIAYAIQHLPVDRPPTVGQFRDLCRLSPRSETLRLEAPAPKADPDTVQKLSERMRAVVKPRAGLEWAFALQARDKQGDRLTLAQRAMYRDALGLDRHGNPKPQGEAQ